MFETIPFSSSFLPITSYWEGGDFMERRHDNPAKQKAIKDAVRRMEWEGAPIPGDNPTLNPDQGIVPDKRKSPTHPLVRDKV